MKKRASAPLEILFFIVLLFGFGIIAFVSKDVIDGLNTEIQSDTELSASAKNISSSLTTRLPTIMDGGFILIFALLWIALLVSAYLIDVQPIFMVVSIIFFVISIVIGIGINDAYNEIILDSQFSTMPTYYPATNFILSNLVLVVGIVGFSLILVLYGKSQAR